MSPIGRSRLSPGHMILPAIEAEVAGPLQTSIMTLSDISRSVHDLCLNSRVVRAARVRSFSRARKSDRLGKGNELPFAELHRVTKLVVIDRTAKDGRQPFGGAE